MTFFDGVRVEVREMPPLHVACLRYIGPFKGDMELFKVLFRKLFAWGSRKNLIHLPETKFMSLYCDDPQRDAGEKRDVSVGFTVPQGTRGDGEIELMNVPGGKCAVARFRIDPDQYEKAWAFMLETWFPYSGHEPDQRPCYELYLRNPEKKHLVDLCIPLRG